MAPLAMENDHDLPQDTALNKPNPSPNIPLPYFFPIPQDHGDLSRMLRPQQLPTLTNQPVTPRQSYLQHQESILPRHQHQLNRRPRRLHRPTPPPPNMNTLIRRPPQPTSRLHLSIQRRTRPQAQQSNMTRSNHIDPAPNTTQRTPSPPSTINPKTTTIHPKKNHHPQATKITPTTIHPKTPTIHPKKNYHPQATTITQTIPATTIKPSRTIRQKQKSHTTTIRQKKKSHTTTTPQKMNTKPHYDHTINIIQTEPSRTTTTPQQINHSQSPTTTFMSESKPASLTPSNLTSTIKFYQETTISPNLIIQQTRIQQQNLNNEQPTVHPTQFRPHKYDNIPKSTDRGAAGQGSCPRSAPPIHHEKITRQPRTNYGAAGHSPCTRIKPQHATSTTYFHYSLGPPPKHITPPIHFPPLTHSFPQLIRKIIHRREISSINDFPT